MFSVKEKQKIADAVEKALLEINHPEMPAEKPYFELHVNGRAVWSFADIKPNWWWEDQGSPKNPNEWNEIARDVLPPRKKTCDRCGKETDNLISVSGNMDYLDGDYCEDCNDIIWGRKKE